MSEQGLLARLGTRLRALREEQGHSLAELARRAGVSRRYLTEAEAGRANLTVRVLERLSTALETSPAALFAPGSEAGESERIALLGLRGAGKSSVGRLLARELEVPFVELDQRVEELAGLSLAELFDLRGPEAFERFEAEALERVLAEGNRLVLATGGSLVNHARTFARLCATCRTVWLRAEPEEHFARVLGQGDRRPMRARPRAMQELRAILDQRAGLYARCELTLATSGRSPDELARELVRRLARAA
ncbi:MAG: helix-turn-helix domain-containing protein [Planctomycetes bacterium]|nr:helix-turn-helix domain-containing protein [Planctomycetota bacterium]